jgi:hypothetical protein
MRRPEPNENDTASIFVDLVTGMLHDGGPVDLAKVLEANHASGNGIEDHILNCPICQRKMKRKVAR